MSKYYKEWLAYPPPGAIDYVQQLNLNTPSDYLAGIVKFITTTSAIYLLI